MISKDTSYMGIIGNPLGHSFSPLIYNTLFQKTDFDGLYLPFEVSAENMERVLHGLKVLGFVGWNVTMPFKETVIPYLDQLSDEVKICRSVNLIKNDAGKLTGYNTDGRGFTAALKDEDIGICSRALFIGAGGAARSIACEMSREGMSHADFLDLNPSRAGQMADFIRSNTTCSSAGGPMTADELNRLAPLADIIINCSPVGMFPHVDASPLDNLAMIKKETVIADIVYNPSETRLLRMANIAGLKTLGGLPMFIHQARLTLEILLDAHYSAEELREVVEPYVSK